ncbi:homocysteine S-methyltransferase family protein [Aurantimonas sp. 22II-16-19i]|uniref:homocysteine S-methyltransferase family protein n=1 Tax=Aurantimonas sp. 22II-16-19i TaxID=1317114 RepID=UPI001592B109|nr:homocysteine S-methyltransferase family protein [Aurantimonas sp. 22II-16-19i]
MPLSLVHRLRAGHVLLADGAMGTNLLSAGLAVSRAPETSLEERPEAIGALHRAFLAAGADVLLTCSFGANRPRLALWDAAPRCVALNRRAAELARDAAATVARPVLVAGSIGPTWRRPGPGEDASHEDDEAEGIFAEQIAGLKAGGVDLVWLETMVSASEARAGARAAIAAGLSYVATASFGAGGRTPAGESPLDFAAAFDGLPVPPLAIGANCCEGPATALAAAAAMARTDGVALAVKPNCGLPQLRSGVFEHPVGPAAMARHAHAAVAAGARLVGACCGATPAHVAAMRRALDHPLDAARPR